MKRTKTHPVKLAPAPCTLDAETRDLLTRAATAAGIVIYEWVGDQANVEMDGGHYGWNPLASWGKGEALSLMVKLRLGVTPLEGGGWDVEHFDHHGNGGPLASCANGGAWALQEAIVRAAAQLCHDGVKGREEALREVGAAGPLGDPDVLAAPPMPDVVMKDGRVCMEHTDQPHACGLAPGVPGLDGSRTE